MTDYECPTCGGGFPSSAHDGACPWCGEDMDGQPSTYIETPLGTVDPVPLPPDPDRDRRGIRLPEESLADRIKIGGDET